MTYCVKKLTICSNAGARILYIFNEAFAKQMDKIDPLHGLGVQDIKTAIKNASVGVKLFVRDTLSRELELLYLFLIKPLNIFCGNNFYS
jgi:hypothetical protein